MIQTSRVQTILAADPFLQTESYKETQRISRKGQLWSMQEWLQTQNPAPAWPRLTPKCPWAVAVRKRWGSAPPPPGDLEWSLTLSSASLPAPTQRPVRGESKLPAQPVAVWGCWEPQPSPLLFCACRLPFTIFQGGMPRASYGDRHCISVVHNGQQTAFDFTSRVIDFTVLSEVDPTAGRRASGVVWRASPWEV